MSYFNGGNGMAEKETVALCASCDRCRSRKTRCDGKRPCSNCASKYLKKNKLSSIEGIDFELFDCVYSPAKRRGPVPGRSGQARKANEAFETSSNGISANMPTAAQTVGSSDMFSQTTSNVDDMSLRQMLLSRQQQASMMGTNAQPQGGHWGGGGGVGLMDPSAAAAAGLGGNTVGVQSNLDEQVLQQQLNLLQQLQAQQREVTAAMKQNGGAQADDDDSQQPATQRQRGSEQNSQPSVPRSVTDNLHLLERDSRQGRKLRACYQLSVDELYCLPPIPTDEAYCASLNIPGMNPSAIPQSHRAALMAARFAELALGALVSNEVALAMELSNATVLLLKESMMEAVKLPYVFEIARAYFLLGCFRVFRGDLERYFKYRRVCMNQLSQLDVASNESAELLLAAMSYLDSWAYMIHNADENKLPSIDDALPPIRSANQTQLNEREKSYDVALGTQGIVSDPKNQMWIQGAPPVFLNNSAPANARSLDALACAIRTCCDEANSRFCSLDGDSEGAEAALLEPITPTCSAVMAHEDELCSRNMVLSSFTLLQQHEASSSSRVKHQGHHLVISAMDAFLENGDGASSGGFTDSQIQSLLTVCNTVVENPFLLHHGGPTYHMVSNAAILLCHLLNGMHAMKSSEADEESRNKAMEAALFEDVLDTLLSVRKLLNIHRRKLPVLLRCHGIPRPSIHTPPSSAPFVDLGETLMCGCRGCQGFVLMACSPCVAAERAKTASKNRQLEMSLEESEEKGELDKELFDLENEFDLDDDELLNMLSRIVST